MPVAGTILCLDLGVNVGFAHGNARDIKPYFGGWVLPALGDLHEIESNEARRSILTGARGAALENELEALMAVVRPTRMVMALHFAASQTSAYLLTGLAVAAEISAYRAEVQFVDKIAESHARKEVLGRGSFGLRDPDRPGKIIKGTGTKAAKSAVLEWCHTKGWMVPNDDVGDACILFEYARRQELARQQWAPARVNAP